jgi:hypothetical protein
VSINYHTLFQHAPRLHPRYTLRPPNWPPARVVQIWIKKSNPDSCQIATDVGSEIAEPVFVGHGWRSFLRDRLRHCHSIKIPLWLATTITKGNFYVENVAARLVYVEEIIQVARTESQEISLVNTIIRYSNCPINPVSNASKSSFLFD